VCVCVCVTPLSHCVKLNWRSRRRTFCSNAYIHVLKGTMSTWLCERHVYVSTNVHNVCRCHDVPCSGASFLIFWFACLYMYMYVRTNKMIAYVMTDPFQVHLIYNCICIRVYLSTFIHTQSKKICIYSPPKVYMYTPYIYIYIYMYMYIYAKNLYA